MSHLLYRVMPTVTVGLAAKGGYTQFADNIAHVARFCQRI
nr:MAG TPA: hypothetical protein [Caudoviricetes sp.]